VRLSANWLILTLGYLIGSFPGIVVGATAISVGVISEAVFVGFRTHPVRNNELRKAKPVDPPLTFIDFMSFYIPLAMTSLLTLLANPIGSAALSRMPDALASLAVWPVVAGLIFMFRSMGIAYNEVVVALLDEPYSSNNLRRFSILLSSIATLILFLITATPLSNFWFVKFSALPSHLVELAQRGLWLALPLPALSVWQSWYQGAILHSRRTRGITEAVVIYLFTNGVILVSGVLWGQTTGLYIGLAALTASVFTQTGWLWYRSLPSLRKVKQRDTISPAAQPQSTL
jgi:hypothetical protein